MTSCVYVCLCIFGSSHMGASDFFLLFNRKINWDIVVFTQVRTIIVTAEKSKLKYCHPHSKHLHTIVSFVCSFFGGSCTHSENKNAKPSHSTQCVLHKSEKIERGIGKWKGKERERERSTAGKLIYSWNIMSIWRFFRYTWYWYCAFTVWNIVCVRELCNVFGVWPCGGLFCLAFLLLCVSCCRSTEINIQRSHTQFNGKNIPRSIQFARSLSSTKFGGKRFSNRWQIDCVLSQSNWQNFSLIESLLGSLNRNQWNLFGQSNKNLIANCKERKNIRKWSENDGR